MNQEEFKETIDMAIQAEIDAANFYRNLRESVKNESSKVLLKELENMEWAHKHILEHLDTATIEEYEGTTIPDLKISESLLTPTNHEHISVQEIIVLAIKREEEALQRYTKLAEETDDQRIKKLLLHIASQEAKHKLQLETIYDEEILYEN